MKVGASVKLRDPKNDKFVRRKGRNKKGKIIYRLYVVNKKKPKNKQRQG